MFRAPQRHGAAQTHFPPNQGRANPNGAATSRTYFGHTVRHAREANISHDTANRRAHQRHAAFTPACFALPSGTAPRKRTSHQGRANPNGAAASRTYFGRAVCPHTRRHSDITDVISPHRLPLLTPALKGSLPRYFCTTNWPLLSPAPKSSFPYYICTAKWPLLTPALKCFPVLLLYYKLATSESSSKTLFPFLHLYYKLATSDSSSEKFFPALHLYYKLATSQSSSEKLLPALHLHYELARSESSSTSAVPSLQNERFVRDFLQK